MSTTVYIATGKTAARNADALVANVSNYLFVDIPYVVYGNKKNERKAEIIVEALIYRGIAPDENEKNKNN